MEIRLVLNFHNNGDVTKQEKNINKINIIKMTYMELSKTVQIDVT